ncbi:Rv3235 family protein [Nakamurella antarctica]|uniref:Rv3235 family protein n=1 Tax=Nakamurella antarctica TaxID=1902245 RepID=UPI0026863593
MTTAAFNTTALLSSPLPPRDEHQPRTLVTTRPYLCAVPACEPPFDDDPANAGWPRGPVGRGAPPSSRFQPLSEPSRRAAPSPPPRGVTAHSPGTFSAVQVREAAPAANAKACAPATLTDSAPRWAAPTSQQSAGVKSGPAAPTTVIDAMVPSWSEESDCGITRTPTRDLPPAREIAGVLSRAVVEVMTGYRQLAQLRVHCAPTVFAGLARMITPAGTPPRLVSVRSSEPADGVVEACAVFRRQERTAALAFRLQGIDGRWRITALQIG